MNIRPVTLKILLIAFASLFLFQCSGDKKSETSVDDSLTEQDASKHEHEQDITRTEAGKPEFTVQDVFQQQIATLFSSYVTLKDAFVSSDANKVKGEAKKTKESLEKVDMGLVEGAAHNNWMSYHGEMDSALKAIQESGDIEKQREHFSTLSNALYKVIKSYGLGGTTAYYEFCPMAFDDKGAYWLSDNAKIRNPYFGDKMLTCGSVQETLQ